MTATSATLPAMLLATALLASAAAAAEPDYATLYQQGCASCHGKDGSGLAPDHPNLANFKRPPASLTDPLFNSREPTFDWYFVIKHGGPALGLSSQMPSYDGVYTDEQIHGLVAYLKTLADTAAYPPGDLNFPRGIRTIKAFPEDEALLLHRFSSEEGVDDSLRTTLYYARRLAEQHQIELKVNYFNGDDAGFKEAEVGWKWAFHHDLQRLQLTAGGVEVEIPIDGGDENEVWIPYMSLGKGFGDFIFQGTLRSHLPSDDVGAGDVELSALFQWQGSPRQRLTPGLEAVLTSPFQSDGDFEATVIPQALIRLSKLGHVAFGVGVEVPVTGIDYDYRLHSFLLWDFADGPFWRSW